MMVHEFCKKEGYCVKYIFQFARITAFCLAGEVLAAVLPLPIPASVYGQLMNLLLPAVLAIVPITALVMAVTGMVAQKCAGGKEHKNG